MSNRIYGLDLLRAFAVLSVVYEHGRNFLYDRHSDFIYSIFIFDGVSFFFVLSGFLIGGILLNTIQKTDFAGRVLLDFWIRRWFRTLPSYYLIISIICLAKLVSGRTIDTNILSYLTFSQNLYYQHPSFFPEAWSLAVEEWFYIIFPFSLFLFKNIFNLKKTSVFIIFVVGFILAITAFRTQYIMSADIQSVAAWDSALRKIVVFRLDSIMFGVLAAYLKFHQPKIFFHRPETMMVFGIALLFADKMMMFSPAHLFHLKYFSFTVVSIGTILLLPKLFLLKNGSGNLFKFATFISMVSYPMYLLNLTPVQLMILPRLLRLPTAVTEHVAITASIKYMAYWILTIGLSYFFHKYFENPATNIRDRLSRKLSVRKESLANVPSKN